MFVLGDDINYSPHLSTPEKDLLRCLASHCGDKAVCWPSVERIGAFMNMTVRSVQRYLRRVAELRLVEIVPKRGKTNLYRVLCLEERKLSTPPQQPCHPEQNSYCTNQRSNGSSRKVWKSPKEVKLLVEDMAEVLGVRVAERNRGWLWRIAQAVPDTWCYEALSWLREAMQYGEVRSPSALLTWRLRTMGATI